MSILRCTVLSSIWTLLLRLIVLCVIYEISISVNSGTGTLTVLLWIFLFAHFRCGMCLFLVLRYLCDVMMSSATVSGQECL